MYDRQEIPASYPDASHSLVPCAPAQNPRFRKRHPVLLRGAALVLCGCLLGGGAGAGAVWSLTGTGQQGQNAAAAAGLRAGDIITRIDGTDIPSMAELSAVKKAYSAGDTAQFTVIRGGTAMQIPVTWGAKPDSAPSSPQGAQPQRGQAGGSSGYGSPFVLVPYYGG